MLVVSDLEDVFLPRTSDLLVNIVESRRALEGMLAGLNDMFKDAYSPGSAMGPALQAAFQLAVRSPNGPISLSLESETKAFKILF